MYPGYVFGVDTPYWTTLSTNKQELEVNNPRMQTILISLLFIHFNPAYIAHLMTSR